MQGDDATASRKRPLAGNAKSEDAERLFAGPSEMHARGRELEWAATSLGPVAGWPPTLRAVVRACLDSPFAMSLWCAPDLILIYNDAYIRVLGSKHPGALGRPGADVWPEIWPQIGPMFERIRAGGSAVLARDAPFHMRRSGESADDGELAWFTYSLSAIRDEGGAIVGFLNIAAESTQAMIAQQQAMEEHVGVVRALDSAEAARARLADIFRQAPALMAVLQGPDHVFALANDAYYDLVGRRDLLGKPVLEALPEVRGQGFVQVLDDVLRTGQPFVGHEVPVRLARSPGTAPEERFVTFIYHPLTDPDGKRSGILAHGMDVTEGVRARAEVERLLAESELAREAIERAHARLVSQQKELEVANHQLKESAMELETKTEELQSIADQLAERTREAEAARRTAVAANRLKSEFLATMSHEFRTPLNAILGYTQLLDMGVLGPATPAQHAHLARLEASARHLLQLVDDVLDVAKVDADRLEVRREPQESGAAIEAAVALIQPQAAEKGVTLTVLGAGAPSPTYVGDEHRVRQILVNLLSNAVKFTGSGGRVTITFGKTTEPDPGVSAGEAEASTTGSMKELEWAYIRVEDTGPGIQPALMGRLFEPFVQGDGALTREQGGTGLGLAISRRLARLMGGDITVRSQPGSGAAFTLWLPTPGRIGHPSAAARRAAEAHATDSSHTSSSAWVTAAAESSSGDIQLDEDAHAALHALGARLSAEAETVAEHYVAALRADGSFPRARELPAVQLRDHATPLVGLVASQLMVIGETRGGEPDLLADGAQAQRLMSELHGAQRYRLGWREEDIERETSLLIAEVERAIVAGVAAATETSGVAGEALSTTSNHSYLGGAATDSHGGVVISTGSVSAAARYATDTVRQALEQGMRTALRSYRFAKASEAL